METQRHELETFLGNGEFYTAEQQDQIIEEFHAWERDLGDEADEEESAAVLTAIAQRVAGDLDLDGLAAADRTAQSAAAKTRLELKAAVVALVMPRHVTESEAERRAGVTRATIRAWVGK